MNKYITMADGWVSTQYTPESRPSCEVFETDHAPIKTGILSADGTPIYRVIEKQPIGFAFSK